LRGGEEIVSDKTFSMDESGWFHAAQFGEHPLRTADGEKIIQVIDDAGVAEMVQWLNAEKKAEEDAGREWAGLLINRDHLYRTNPDADTEAMGWILAAEKRDDGLWLNAKWSIEGERRIAGGVYKFVSPEFDPTSAIPMGESRKRPTRLLGCALTNTPNLRGLHPLCNRAALAEPEIPAERYEMNELKEIAAALGLGEDADLAAIVAKIKEMADAVAMMNAEKKETEAQAFLNANKELIADADAVKAVYLRDPETAKALLNAVRRPAPAKPPVSVAVPARTPEQAAPEGSFRDESGKVWSNRLAFHRTLKGAEAAKHMRAHKAELLRLQSETK
jgi:hypothetical protein